MNVSVCLVQGAEDDVAWKHLRSCCFLIGFYVPKEDWTSVLQPQTADVNAVARSEACRAVWDAMQEGCDSAAEQQASQLRTNT